MKTTNTQAGQDISGSYRTPDGKAQIDFGITYRNGYAEFTASGHYNGSSGQCIDEIAEAYPDDKQVQLWHKRWKIHHLKNADMIKSLVAAEARKFPAVSFYDTQAETFLTSNGIRFRATLSDTKTPAWEHNGRHGHHYRVTLSGGGEYIRPGRVDSTEPAGFVSRGKLTQKRRLTFDFWGSIADAEKGVTTVKPYDVLACISSDAYCPETFKDFCAEYGYEPDSIKVLQTFRRCSAFAKRLRAFFTQAELEQLQEIR